MGGTVGSRNGPAPPTPAAPVAPRPPPPPPAAGPCPAPTVGAGVKAGAEATAGREKAATTPAGAVVGAGPGVGAGGTGAATFDAIEAGGVARDGGGPAAVELARPEPEVASAGTSPIENPRLALGSTGLALLTEPGGRPPWIRIRVVPPGPCDWTMLLKTSWPLGVFGSQRRCAPCSTPMPIGRS